MFICLWIKSPAQGLVNHAALITVSDALVHVGSGFDNKGSFLNKGTLSIEGDWINNGTYLEENGSVILSGFNNQTVHADGINFSDLTIAGSGDKILAFNTTLSGVLDFASARLKVIDDTLILDSQLEIYGINDQSYIIGRVFRSGEGELEFPIGSDTQYMPATLMGVEGTNPMIAMEAMDVTPIQGSGNNFSISSSRFWVMTKDENYSKGLIRLAYDDDFTVSETSNIVVAQATSDQGDFNTLGAESLEWGFESGGLVTSKGLAVGPYFTIGYTGLEDVLPPVRVINALTPIQDGKHDYMRVENIELYQGNEVKIYDRQGGLVWKKSNYDNADVAFRGSANQGPGGELPDGNYFYTIQYKGKNLASGFVFLKR